MVNGQTLTVELVEPDPTFIHNLQFCTYSPVPMEELYPSGTCLNGPSSNGGAFLAWKRYPIGAGPYKIISTSEEESIVDVEAVVPLAANVPQRIRFSVGPSVREVDIAYGFCSNPDPRRLQPVRLNVVLAMRGVYFDYHHPLARDENFRRAVALALDYDAIVAAAPGWRPANGMIPSHMARQLSQYPTLKNSTDAREAARIFKNVLTAISTPLPMAIGSQYVAQPIPEWIALIAAQLRAAGCPVQFVTQPYLQPLSNGNRAPLCIGGFIPSVHEIGKIFLILREGSGWIAQLNERDELYEMLLRQLGKECDTMRREEVICRLAQRFHDQHYIIPILEEPVTYWINPQRIQSISETYQGIDPAFHKIVMNQ